MEDRLAPLDLLRAHFGFSSFRPGQLEVITSLFERKAALAVFPTGAGKSLCYQLPALALDGVTLVISPLIALMKDQIDFLKKRGISAERLDSTLGEEEHRSVMDRLQAGSLKLLYVAPERFNNERFLARLAKTRIALFAVDEAHCVSEWGHNFRPDYLKLAQTARALNAERVLALTATATPAVVEGICESFRIPRDCAVVTGFYRENLHLIASPVESGARDRLLLQKLKSRPPGPTIVYVTLQKTAERVAALLSASGVSARSYHAGMDDGPRAQVQEWWKAGAENVVVATIAFGMGIDKSDVRYVYHYNLPKSLESYSQEIGRAGRDGKVSVVELLACPDDVAVLENFAYGDTPTEAALLALCEELLAQDEQFDVSTFELSARHDLRPLVLKTALTYLELLGVLKQGTPFYAGYQFQPLIPEQEILSRFEGERQALLSSLFAASKKGRVWYTVELAEAARTLKQDRQRLARALEYLEEKGWVKLQVSEVRQRYTRLRESEDAKALAAELDRRFLRREEQEIARVAQVLAQVTREGCQANALAAYFGELRAERCGHCSFCTDGRKSLPRASEPAPLPGALPEAELRSLRENHRAALGHPRQAARFLCGLSSPATSKAKLTKHKLFGALEDRRFREVLKWLSSHAADELGVAAGQTRPR